MSEAAQQSRFQSLATPSVSTTGFLSERKEAKPHKEVRTPKETKEWVGRAKEERKNEKWKEWGIDFQFKQQANLSKSLSFRHLCISTHV